MLRKTFLFLFLFSFYLFSQDNNSISLDSNGVTIKCPGADIGYTQTVSGKEYTVVDRASLVSVISTLGDVTCLCTSNVTDMSELFKSWPSYNQDIGSWDTSSATTMRSMFDNSQLFNQDLSLWNTSNVTDMSNMFYNNQLFGQNISGWDKSKVPSMERMFKGAYEFDGDSSS